jgi:hypothetical protein
MPTAPPKCPILLAVDQELGEGAAPWVALSDDVAALGVGDLLMPGGGAADTFP